MTFWQSTPKLAGLSALSEILTYRWGLWLAVAVDKRNLQNSGWNRIRTEVRGVGWGATRKVLVLDGRVPEKSLKAASDCLIHLFNPRNEATFESYLDLGDDRHPSL